MAQHNPVSKNICSNMADENDLVVKRPTSAKERIMATMLRLLLGVVVSVYLGACGQQELKSVIR